MRSAADYMISAGMGGAIGLGMAAAAAMASLIGRRGRGGPYRAGSLRGAAFRLAGALAGVTLGVALRPPSVATFVLVFLATYLVGNAVLTFRLGV